MRYTLGLAATCVLFATTDSGSWTRFYVGLALFVVITIYLVRELRADAERRPPE